MLEDAQAELAAAGLAYALLCLSDEQLAAWVAAGWPDADLALGELAARMLSATRTGAGRGWTAGAAVAHWGCSRYRSREWGPPLQHRRTIRSQRLATDSRPGGSGQPARRTTTMTHQHGPGTDWAEHSRCADVTGFPPDSERPDRRYSNIGGAGWHIGCEHRGCSRKARVHASADHDCCGKPDHDITHEYWARDGRHGENLPDVALETRAAGLGAAVVLTGVGAALAWAFGRRD